MKHRPTRAPRTPLEEAAAQIAAGEPGGDAAFEMLARQAGLTDAQISAGRGNAFEGVGTIDTHVVVLCLPIEVVADLLPAGLELAPQPLTFPDKHPVFFLFSHDVFDAWFGTMDYQEMMIGIPYVQLCDVHAPNRGPFIYMPRLYLNAQLPRVLGNSLYGFEKLEASITNIGGRYTVAEADGTPLATATFKSTRSEGPVSSLTNFETVRQIFEQPTVSQALRIVDENAFYDQGLLSPFLCTTITYALADPATTIEPVEAELELGAAISPPGLPVTTFARPSLLVDGLGSFRLKAKQVVSLPGSCEHTRYTGPYGRKRKVVVLGGGPSACAAAYFLAKQQDRYDVEMYTVGWRLGGKCAAGRNADRMSRIEEHGLHAFVGFYENAIRTMKEVYADAGLEIARGKAPYDYDKGEGPIANGFIGTQDVGVMEYSDKMGWQYFATPQKRNDKIPGTIPTDGENLPQHFGHAIAGALRKVADDVHTMLGSSADAAQASQFDAHLDPTAQRHAWWNDLVVEVEDAVDIRGLGLKQAFEALVRYLEDVAIEEIAHEIETGSRFFCFLAKVLEVIRTALKVVLSRQIEAHEDTWFLWAGADTLLTALIGLIDEKVVEFHALDNKDFRTWLESNGLDKRNSQISAINQVYETMFAHPANSTDPGAMAAGVALRWFVLVGFLYSGYPAYEFRYSCPQTMLSPYYVALQNLGVKVHFFHRVEELQFEGKGDTRALGAIKMQVQASLADGVDHYDPFTPPIPENPPSHPAWPDRPNYDQLAQGDELRRSGVDLENPWSEWKGLPEPVVLTHGADFDLCVLGIPISALRHLAAPLTKPESPTWCPQWQSMLDGVKVIPTISAQLWFDSPAEALMRDADKIGLLTCFAGPEPSYANFSHLIEWEAWDPQRRPQTLAYHTGSKFAISVNEGYPDEKPDFPAREATKWKQDFARWLEGHFEGLYNKVDTFEDLTAQLAAPAGATGVERLNAQYFNISTHPSDLYVLSQPDAIKLRLGQSQSWVRHLFLCGDWTFTDLNAGCVEASTQSGMLAARAISNYPTYIWRTGF